MSVRHISVTLINLTLITVVHADERSEEQRDQEFSKRMAKTVLVGAFTIGDRKLDAAPKEERYEITSVKKSSGNIWVFTARVKYLNFDATLPNSHPRGMGRRHPRGDSDRRQTPRSRRRILMSSDFS